MDELARLILTASAIIYMACIVKAFKGAKLQISRKEMLELVTSAAIVIGASVALMSSLHYALKIVLANALFVVIVRNHLRLYHSKAQESAVWFAAYFVSALGLAASSAAILISAVSGG